MPPMPCLGRRLTQPGNALGPPTARWTVVALYLPKHQPKWIWSHSNVLPCLGLVTISPVVGAHKQSPKNSSQITSTRTSSTSACTTSRLPHNSNKCGLLNKHLNMHDHFIKQRERECVELLLRLQSVRGWLKTDGLSNAAWCWTPFLFFLKAKAIHTQMVGSKNCLRNFP